jgi:class 3 adenylate cyclase
MDTSRQATVLFADVTGSTKLYELAGDAKAVEAIGHCIEVLRKAVDACAGRVVKTIGDEVMALFPTPDAAADAAARMHMAVETLPAISGHKLAVRVGFHTGPVVQRDNDVFGDTVNLASRLVEQAVKGQVLTCDDTAALLTPALRNSMRRLYSITVKGKSGEIALCELIWRRSPDVTDLSTSTSRLRLPRAKLRLKYGERVLVMRRENDSLLIGREPTCQFVIADPRASRQHCTIERRQDRFVLQDHSGNGTYVTVAGEKEIVLQREDFPLRNQGWIAFGQPRAEATDVLEYFCESAAKD